MKNRSRQIYKVESYNYPSRFGSHASMVNFEQTAKLFEATQDESLVVLTDEFGDYVTNRSRLDSRMADPNRYAGYTSSRGSTSISKESFSKHRSSKINGLLATKAEPKYK